MLNPSPQLNRSGDPEVCEHSDDGNARKQSVDGEVPEHTLQSLFDAEETALLRFAFSLIGRRAIAEEIVQEVFLQLHVRWDQVDSPRAWLFQSVRNRVYNHLRDHRREVYAGDECETTSDDTDPSLPESNLMQIEAAGALRESIEDLDETDQQLVKLKYFEGLKYRDISERTGLTVGNVGYRLHHVLKELARKLRPLGLDENS